ncbi:DinB family protein [Desmospora profundinema]|uniref:DinB-like domain-containing protein n=1 Tax=Desmospora profundinema TaxID=1571184 RepID=A0ABU1II24_9BACL|nr:DinB family protein [Desmospora profundinema]MDR6224427.1 hypothetical protein [Desmospora profundinema]
MDTKVVLQKFEETATEYIHTLDQYSPEQFAQKPAPDEWSLGQMYQHLLTFTTYQISLIEKCANGQGEPGGQKTDWGQKLFEKGDFPPIKIKLPDRPEFTPENLTDPKQTKEQLLDLVEKVRGAEPKLASAPVENKLHHPRLGWLNALEWFQLIPMHFRHHLHQKRRLEEECCSRGGD